MPRWFELQQADDSPLCSLMKAEPVVIRFSTIRSSLAVPEVYGAASWIHPWFGTDRFLVGADLDWFCLVGEHLPFPIAPKMGRVTLAGDWPKMQN